MSDTNKHGLDCPACGNRESEVIDSRPTRGRIRRRRVCSSCSGRFTTVEIPLSVYQLMENAGLEPPKILNPDESAVRFAVLREFLDDKRSLTEAVRLTNEFFAKYLSPPEPEAGVETRG